MDPKRGADRFVVLIQHRFDRSRALPFGEVQTGHLAVGPGIEEPPLDLVDLIREVFGEEVLVEVGALVGEDELTLGIFAL